MTVSTDHASKRRSAGRTEFGISPWLVPAFALSIYLGRAEELLYALVAICVHELGHVLAAFLVGVRPLSAELGLSGFGMEFSERLTQKNEFAIASAGPLTSVFIWLLLSGSDRAGLQSFANISLAIGLFNLMPAFPSDGGRMLRAALSEKLGVVRSTDISALLGVILGAAVFALGVLSALYSKLNITLVIAGLAVALSAISERKRVRRGAYVVSLSKADRIARGAVETRMLSAGFDTPLGEIMDAFFPDRFHIITIFSPDMKKAYRTDENAIAEACAIKGRNATAGSIFG